MYLSKETMRYYRLWIYTCNAVLFVSVLVFSFAAVYILSDSRRQLVFSVQLYHPSFLYAYVAILVQGGVVQVIGCLGALKLNERLLNTYWMILFGLLVGDVIVGGVWMARFESLTSGISPDLYKRLQTEYASNEGNFRHLFDELQAESQCCGVENPKDYNATWWQKIEEEYFLDYERTTNHTDEHFLDDFEDDDDDNLDREDILLPWSCCVADRLIEEPAAMANKIRGRLLAKSHDETKANHPDGEDDNGVPLFPGSSLPSGRRRYYILRKKGTKGFLTPEEKILFGEEPIFMQGKWCTYSPQGSDWHHHVGCVEPLTAWVKSGGDILFVIGLCVVAFVKFTFLSILRYEIKEMIQKIKMMKNETQQMNGELATALGMNNSNLSASDASSITTSPQSGVKMAGLGRSDSKSRSMEAAQHQPHYHQQHQSNLHHPQASIGNDIRPRPKRRSPSEHPSVPNSPNSDRDRDRLIDTRELDPPMRHTCESQAPGTSLRPPWQRLPSPSGSSSHLSDLAESSSKVSLHQPDSFWCSFRPIQPEASVCANNVQGSSRQTAI